MTGRRDRRPGTGPRIATRPLTVPATPATAIRQALPGPAAPPAAGHHHLSLSAPLRWPLPALVLAAYFLLDGACFKPTLQFYWMAANPYLATAVVLGAELSLLAMIIIFRLGRFARQPWTITAPLVFLFGLLAWTGLSLLWSVSEKPFESAGYWFQEVAAALIVLEGCAFLPGQRGPALARACYAIGLSILALQAVAFHQFELLDPLELEWDKNIFAHAAAFLALIGLDGWARQGWRLDRSSAGWMVAIACAALVIAHYTSKTVVGALAAAGAVHVLVSGGDRRKWLGVGLLAGGLVFALWGPVSDTWDRYNRDAAYSSTLSERTLVWEFAWRFINEHPGLGLGFDGFRQAVPGIFNVGIAHAHNDVLMVWANLGLPGVLLAGGWYLAVLVAALAAWRAGGARRTEAVLPLTLMVYTLIRGQVEADAFLATLPVHFSTLCVVALARVGTGTGTAPPPLVPAARIAHRRPPA